MKFLTELDPLVSLPVGIALATLYVLLVFFGNAVMKSRAPLELTEVKFVYNLAQIGICSLVFAKLLPFFLTAEHMYGLRILPNPTVEWWVFVYWCCKLLDFCDTVFMVLGKKTRQISGLHLWHHASIVPLFSYLLSAGKGGGFVCALPLLNSFVHVLMYSHYLVTSVKCFKRLWWKPLLTGTQMGHHIVLIAYMALSGVLGHPEWTPRIAIAGILWGLSILGLFAKFYVDQYKKKGGRQD
eukprot:TRINITY_DN5068_c0_g2_i1.p1 TRINITY_DN5068_c0_g2~~TRINITY_DN5068_c0_g2_i1.p1  ORF type:complete len:240 (+),score=26.68 TRINITY_DN5068_c0_g2_i1:138-857(+)